MHGRIRNVLSNEALTFILSIAIFGLIAGLFDPKVLAGCFALCLWLWVGVGIATFSMAFKDKIVGYSDEGFKEGVSTGIRAALYGPFAYKLFYRS